MCSLCHNKSLTCDIHSNFCPCEVPWAQEVNRANDLPDVAKQITLITSLKLLNDRLSGNMHTWEDMQWPRRRGMNPERSALSGHLFAVSEVDSPDSGNGMSMRVYVAWLLRIIFISASMKSRASIISSKAA